MIFAVSVQLRMSICDDLRTPVIGAKDEGRKSKKAV